MRNENKRTRKYETKARRMCIDLADGRPFVCNDLEARLPEHVSICHPNAEDHVGDPGISHPNGQERIAGPAI